VNPKRNLVATFLFPELKLGGHSSLLAEAGSSVMYAVTHPFRKVREKDGAASQLCR
jgi:hypothetical protein